MAKRTTDEALKVLQELEPEYTFRFEGGYKSAKTKNLHVTCNHGHEYITYYDNFVNNKARCNQCANEKKSIEKRFNEGEALKVLYSLEPNYSFKFIDGYKKAISKNLYITCDKGHEYVTTYNNFVNMKQRCPYCYGNAKLTEGEVLNNLKEMEKDYSFRFEGGYINNSSKNLHITCNNGHEYLVTYNNFRKGQRCPYCVNRKSKPESEIIDYIKSFYYKDIIQSNRTLIKNIHSNRNLELDIYLPDIKVAIEFNGLYWHSDKVIKERKKGFSNAKEYHEYKSNQCNQLGIHLIHIEEQDYIDNQPSILESIKNIITSY